MPQQQGINNTQVFKNTFEGGLNLDVNIDLLKPNQCRDAVNIAIESDGEFFVATNLNGTTQIEQLFVNTDATTPTNTDNKYNLLGVFAANGFTTDNPPVIYPALVIIDAYQDGTGSFKLRVATYNTQTDTYNIIYTRTFSTNDDTLLETVADAVIYSEAGTETIYFTDNWSGIYKVPIKVNSATPYTDEDVILIRKAPKVFRGLLPSTAAGGSLKCGSYQFAIRYINSSLNVKTKWSMLSEPIRVSMEVSVATEIKNSKIGVSSGKKILYYWDYDTTQAAEYDYAEIAVVEHIDGTANPSQTATIVGPVTISSLVSGGYLFYEHKGNSGIPLDISELLIDEAAIKTANTVAVKNNRLFLGGITYHSLKYSTKPSVNAGNTQLIYKDLPLTSGSTGDQNSSVYKGYFRDETYRFAVTFHDEFMNWSEPEILDFSSVVENYASGGIDFRFPARDYGTGTYTNKGFLWENGVGNEDLRAIGLQIGINNIPTWAKGMAILRAKRIKKIIAQTPIVPSILIQPAELTAGTPDTYPTSYTPKTGSQKTDSEAQPPNPLGTLSPKNYAHNYNKSIVRDNNGTYSDVPDTACVYTGMALTPGAADGSQDHYQTMHVHFLYPPELLYGDGNQKWNSIDTNGKYALQPIDAALLKCKELNNSYTATAAALGNFADTNVHEIFYAIDKNQYYYHDAQTTNLSYTADYNVLEITHIPYGNESTLLSKPRKTSGAVPTSKVTVTNSVMDYSSLVAETTLAPDGYKATPQECFVCVIDDPIIDITKQSYSTNDPGGKFTNAVAWLTGKIDGASYYSVHTNNFRDGSDSPNVSAVTIANIVTDVDDYRYGEKSQFHEFYHTGTYVDVDGLSTTTVDVWGGDCFVGLFTFKLTDRTYSVPNAVNADSTEESDADLKDRWDRIYDISASAPVINDCPRPVGVKGNAQTLTIALESEINPNSIDYNNDTTGFVGATHPFALAGDYSGSDILIPNAYRCNMSYNIDNLLKVWVPIDDTDRDLTETKSRILYSDQKIYNADVEGFDRFPALNFYDLDETFGEITKLLVSGSNMFAIQEHAYSYLPVESNIMETADAVNLSIRSGEIIGNHKYINTTNGCQHLKTIAHAGNSFYFFDYKNKVLIKFVGEQEDIISDKGVDFKMKSIAHDAYAKRGYEANELVGIYDSKRRQYILAKRYFEDAVYGDVNSFAYVYDDKLGVWVGRIAMDGATQTSIYGGCTGKHGQLYVIGKNIDETNPVYLSTMYTGTIGQFFGVSCPAMIQVIVNPDYDLPKTFDSVIVVSDREVSLINVIVPLTDGIYYSTQIPDLSDVESVYKAKMLRNIVPVGGKTGQRMRGNYAAYEVQFDQTKDTKLKNILTRYRPSNRGI